MKRILYATASLGLAGAITLTMISCGSAETPSAGQGKTTTAASSVASTWTLDGHDECDLADGTSEDCSENGIPDECDIADCPPEDPSCQDCNGNGIPDQCEMTGSLDTWHPTLGWPTFGGGSPQAVDVWDDRIYCLDVLTKVGEIAAGGQIAAWLDTEPASNPQETGLAAYAGHLYHTGGHGGSPSTLVEYAQVNPDGTIGNFLPTTPLATAVSGAAVVAYNEHLYVVGGRTANYSWPAIIQEAPLNPDGTVGSWTQSAMVAPHVHTDAVVYDGWLYGIAGGRHDYIDNRVERCPLNEDGSVGTCVLAEPLPETRAKLSAVMMNGRIYVCGGALAPWGASMTNSIISSRVDPVTHSLGPWEEELDAPFAALSYMRAAVVAGRLYLMSARTPVEAAYTELAVDCNGNGILDECDIADCVDDPACDDCNDNGIPDECDIADCPPEEPSCQDCNDNGIPDDCDIVSDPPDEFVANSNYTHWNGGVGVIDGQLYNWAGLNSSTRHPYLEVYDPTADTWTSLSSAPEDRCAFGDFALNGELYLVGGETSPGGVFRNTGYKYTPPTDTWSSIATFPTVIWDPMTVVCGGEAYVIGGRHGYGRTYEHMYKYDPVGDQWLTMAPMPSGYDVFFAGAVCYDGKIWIFGGNHKTGEAYNEFVRHVLIYDPATDSWEVRTDAMPWLLYNTQAVVYGSRAYLFTTNVYDDDADIWVPSEHVYIYDFLADSWDSRPWQAPAPTQPTSRIPLIGSHAYFVDTYDGAPTTDVYRLDLSATSEDCNANGVPDECDIADCDGTPWCGDCNDNGIPDECDTPICGDGCPMGGEACDDGNASNNDDCLNACTLPTCGDGYVWNEGLGIEECDDAGESATCDADCTAADCGDGTLNETAGEVCDGLDNEECPNTDDGDGGDGPKLCRRDCTCAPPTCGDGVLHVGEQCDGEAQNEDGIGCDLKGCRSDCTCVLPKPRDPMPTEVTRLRSMGDIKRPRDLSASPRGRDSSGP